MNVLQLEVARAVIAKMMSNGTFYITDIDTILKMTGGVPPKREYDMLRALHCISFKDMSPALRLALPRLMQVVVESQPIGYEIGSLPVESKLLPESL